MTRETGGGGRRVGFYREREGKAVAPEFAQRDFDDVGERVTVEDAGDGVAHIEHEHAQTAVHLVGTGAFLVGGLADAADGGERAIDDADESARIRTTAAPTPEKC